MSGLVLNESVIDPATIQTKNITISRIQSINSGVRIWFVILTTENEIYQRWSMLMNPTDELLILSQPGDTITINYINDTVEDLITKQFESFNRTVILKAYK
ncbi:MAG: hypothetical protein EO766_11780 [Hydrotalea sp. AMD]|uniref:hypothetical protein n=1 Tax=Hydrotalea sp. AMD TaxID=2501297 RepID=UPI00102782CC|nr:hypothetical protein [Hydrotalea sp. AMD]RWZ87204.1 MAG: hypothetical protein EO766_11780 [Hydrotalea sp. AMD]